MKHDSVLYIFLLVIGLSLTAGNIRAEDLEAWPLESRQIDGTGDGKDVYYAFTAGPGMVIARAEATIPATAADSRLTVELLDESLNSLATAIAGEVADGGRDRVKEALRRTVVDLLGGVAEAPPVVHQKAVRIKLDDARTVILRVHAGRGVSAYTVRLEGPIELADVEPSVESESGNVTESEEVTQPSAEETVVPFEEEAPAETDKTAADPEPAESKPPIRIKVPGRKAPAAATDTASAPPKVPIRKKVVIEKKKQTPTKVKPGLVIRKLQLLERKTQ